MGSGAVRGVGGLIVYHLGVPQTNHWKKMHKEIASPQIYSLAFWRGEGRGVLKDQLWGGKCVDRVLSEPS